MSLPLSKYYRVSARVNITFLVEKVKCLTLIHIEVKIFIYLVILEGLSELGVEFPYCIDVLTNIGVDQGSVLSYEGLITIWDIGFAICDTTFSQQVQA